jgi:EamA domain-containing membrane protein RarD
LFFLTPALSTVEGALLFDERLGMFALVGLIAAAVGVYLTTAQ